MQIYEYTDYPKLIKAFVEGQKAIGVKLTYQSLADKLRIQKSYFSKILAGNAQLNKDQAYLLGKEMMLSSDQMDYLFLLVDLKRAGIRDLKEEITTKIKTIQNEKLQSEAYLDKDLNELNSNQMQQYYLLPEIQLVHLALSIPKYQKDISALKEDLKINSDIFSSAIKILEELSLIETSSKKVKLLKSNLHLKHDSPFFHQWKTQLKLKGIEWTKLLEKEDKYNFVASFTASEEDKEKIRIEFLNFLKKTEKIVKESKSKSLYQLNFDLFKWI